jgi:hypothetical protein
MKIYWSSIAQEPDAQALLAAFIKFGTELPISFIYCNPNKKLLNI